MKTWINQINVYYRVLHTGKQYTFYIVTNLSSNLKINNANSWLSRHSGSDERSDERSLQEKKSEKIYI